MTLETAALRFAGAGPNGVGWKASCPLCQAEGTQADGAMDGELRLLLRPNRSGRWLVKCLGGCEPEAILAARGLAEEDQAIAAAPARGLALHGFGSEFAPVVLRHLIHPYVPAGKCILLDADGGTGKTSLAAAWAASLSRGRHPTTFRTIEAGAVRTLYLHKGEDGSDEIETVYRANEGIAGMMLYHSSSDLRFDGKGIRLLRETIEDGGFRLVVCDALFYFLEGVVKDTNDNLAATRVIHALTEAMHSTGASMLNIRHTVKDSIGKAASNLGMGTSAFRNAHRGQLVARWHRDAKRYKGVVWVEDAKGSLLNERGEPFAYRRVGNGIEYVHDVEDPDGGPDRTKPVSRLEAAKNLLQELLGPGSRLTKEVEAEADRRGISVRTLSEARKQLGVDAHPGPDGRYVLTLDHYDPYLDS